MDINFKTGAMPHTFIVTLCDKIELLINHQNAGFPRKLAGLSSIPPPTFYSISTCLTLT